jgi:glycosyltransferase involved in cell wall biosynthesis
VTRRDGNTVKAVGQEITKEIAHSKSSLRNVGVSYGCGRYPSHARVARVYRNIIRSRCNVVKEIDLADIVVLHFEPHTFASLFETYPVLRKKYVVGYCVWEASELPISYREAIRQVQEIWTCSQYCLELFEKYCPRVKYVPHVIERDTSYSEADSEHIRRAVSYHPENFYFLMVTKLWDLRKNTNALITAFRNQRSVMPKAKLIIKAGPQDDAGALATEGIIILRENLSETQMNALYATADAYVSPHHSEGWGLTISDAMLFQKPTIATGYSGNREFMNTDNSFLLDFTVDYIEPEDCFYLFDSSMKWAYPSLKDLQQKMLLLYQKRGAPEILQKIRNASNDIQKFNRNSVSAILEKRIMEIVNSDHFSQAVARG